jgi:predicted dehydrogenase
MRFGLVGTGHWAQIAHAPALAATDGIEFAAVWGRNPASAAKLAAEYETVAYNDLDAFLASVDAVAFSVPPDVQAGLAERAASLGKHLLLEKPVGLTGPSADALVDAVDRAGVASVVFFTTRFQPHIRDWLADVTARTGWLGGTVSWRGGALTESSPYNTPWRREYGGLWDVGPHAVSLLWASLGPVTSVTADAGLADITHLILHHVGGVTSTVTVTCSAPVAAVGLECYLWGEADTSPLPPDSGDRVGALRVALTELAANARSGQVTHPCDVRFGAAVTHVLASAQQQLSRPTGPRV